SSPFTAEPIRAQPDCEPGGFRSTTTEADFQPKTNNRAAKVRPAIPPPTIRIRMGSPRSLLESCLPLLTGLALPGVMTAIALTGNRTDPGPPTPELAAGPAALARASAGP